MENDSRKDIRRILKTFGIKADEVMVAHLARNPDLPELNIRIILEDLTDYGDSNPDGDFNFSVEDKVQR